MSLRDAAQQALEALETCDAAHISDGGQQWYDSKAVDAAITALEAALAEPQPQPEPVAPPQRQPLTDMEIARLCVLSLTEAERIDSTPAYALARAIEKAHGIGGDK